MILITLNNRPLPVYGNGMNIRDWIHVLDHCSAIDLIIHKGSIGEVYNIGGNEERSSISVVKEILNLCNIDYSMINFVTDRKGHDLRYAIDSSKLEALGWDRKFTFDSGLNSTIEWYRNNSEWLESLDFEFNLPCGTLIKSHIIKNK
jgi:dTDP-glucose 4,6-dehydratase